MTPTTNKVSSGYSFLARFFRYHFFRGQNLAWLKKNKCLVF